MWKVGAFWVLMVATSAQADIAAPIYLACKGETLKPDRSHDAYFNRIVRVTNNTLAYWNADGHRFIDNCSRSGRSCETSVDDARIKHTVVADGMTERKVVTTILISRFTGSYMEMFDYVGPKTFENIIRTSMGKCSKVDSPEQGERAF